MIGRFGRQFVLYVVGDHTCSACVAHTIEAFAQAKFSAIHAFTFHEGR